MQCKLKGRCPNKAEALYNCWDTDCNGWMHCKCSSLLLTRHSVPVEDRPADMDMNQSGEPIVFCKKSCYQRWLADKKRAAKEASKAAKQPSKKRKVPWEEDGTMEILMEWLTTEGNYAEYCGANGNKGKTKTQYHKELSLLIKEKLPDSARTEKDVENKITGLERQFRVASDWANNTGAGVENGGEFKAAVLQRCALYDELEPIMGDRPNAKPLASNEDSSVEDAATVPTSCVAATAVNQSNNNGADSDDSVGNLTPRRKDEVSSVSAKSTASSSNKRITASEHSTTRKKGKHTPVDDVLSSYLGEDEEDEDVGNTSFKQLRVREVKARECEARARMLEAQAISGKAKTESELLSIQAKANLLRERKKLLDEGISQEDIDELLPLRK